LGFLCDFEFVFGTVFVVTCPAVGCVGCAYDDVAVACSHE